MNCIFCQIVRGEAKSYNIDEDEDTLTFLDAFPANRGHSLIIPKKHYEDIFSIPDELYAKVTKKAVIIAKLLKESLHYDGLTCVQLNGKASGQTVFHLHYHLIPRWHNDGIFNVWKPLKKETSYFEELHKTILLKK